MVHERKRAVRGMSSQVIAQPRLLRRPRRAPPDRAAVAVQCNEVPSAEIEAVVALPTIACGACAGANSVEVIEVPTGTGRVVLMVPGRRPRYRSKPAPRRLIKILIVRQRSVFVLIITERQDG